MADIRVLSESDAQEFWTLRLRALREEPESFGSAYEESVDTPLADVIKRIKPTEDSFVLGAFAPGLVGTTGCHRRHGIKSRHKATIWGVYVAPEQRGRGLARDLLMATIARAASVSGVEELLLQVSAINQSARNLYVFAASQPYGLERRSLKLGDRYLDEELMALSLANAKK